MIRNYSHFTRGCSHMVEIRDALIAGQWPHAVAPELRAHAATCTRCAQEVLITQHLHVAKTSAMAAAPPAAPGLLWWRAQLRRRNAALEQANRPIAAAQLFAIAITAAAAVCLIATRWHSIVNHATNVPASSFMALLTNWGLAPLILAITLIATLGGLALYLSSDRQ